MSAISRCQRVFGVGFVDERSLRVKTLVEPMLANDAIALSPFLEGSVDSIRRLVVVLGVTVCFGS